MQQQNYKNHIRYYVPHHFVFYPLMLLALIAGIIGWSKQPGQSCLWAATIFLTFIITWLAFMMRQHYALNNQNRLVRLEMRFRYYVLTHQRLEPLEPKLTFAQLAALRFASDAEMPGLLQKAIEEDLSADAIKRSIKDWQPDNMRV